MRVQFRAIGDERPGQFAMLVTTLPANGDYVSVPYHAAEPERLLQGTVVGREFRWFSFGVSVCVVVVDTTLTPDWAS